VTAGGNGRFETNDPNYSQTYNGVEFAAIKRLSNRWMARIAAGWNDHTEDWGDGTPVSINDADGNPTRLDVDSLVNGGQVAARSAGSGSGDIFINGKWSVNAYAVYQAPAGFELAANVFGKQGTPFPFFRSVALGQDGTNRVLINPTVDSERFANLWNLDVRLAKNFKLSRANMLITADLFNVFNSNTELNRQRSLGGANPNVTSFGLLTDYLSPRILRLGMRLGF
jgi:hypothetical protein